MATTIRTDATAAGKTKARPAEAAERQEPNRLLSGLKRLAEMVWFGYLLAPARCPGCHASVSDHAELKPFGNPFGLMGYDCRCRSCGHKWRELFYHNSCCG